MLETQVDLFIVRVIDDFEEGHDVRMPDLFQNGNFPLRLLERRHILCDPSESTLLGEARDNLDCHVLAIVEIAGQLDFAVSTSSNFVENLVVINDLASSGVVSVDVGNMGSTCNVSGSM